jgi:hypothetical protein
MASCAGRHRNRAHIIWQENEVSGWSVVVCEHIGAALTKKGFDALRPRLRSAADFSSSTHIVGLCMYCGVRDA